PAARWCTASNYVGGPSLPYAAARCVRPRSWSFALLPRQLRAGAQVEGSERVLRAAAHAAAHAAVATAHAAPHSTAVHGAVGVRRAVRFRHFGLHAGQREAHRGRLPARQVGHPLVDQPQRHRQLVDKRKANAKLLLVAASAIEPHHRAQIREFGLRRRVVDFDAQVHGAAIVEHQ
nr:hypothetical protein [Tanacetum cinerariifolium]